MDDKIRNIENLLFVPRHMAFNGQISIGVYCFCTVRKFSRREEKTHLAIVRYPVEFLLNARTLKAADFVFQYKVSCFLFGCLQYSVRGPPSPIYFLKNNRR